MTTEQIMHFSSLPYYLTVKRFVDGDLVKVKVESKIHVNKIVICPMSWSVGFVQSKPQTFNNDVLCWVIRRYDLKPAELKYE